MTTIDHLRAWKAWLWHYRKTARAMLRRGGPPYARKQDVAIPDRPRLVLSQRLNRNPEKEHNLRVAAWRIERIVVGPGEYFSFWSSVGAPFRRRGFRASRSIVNGRVVPSVGGGLCQLSGLIYYASLQAGLEIVERHAHSVDIYTEATRFTPLGADATVAFGYKDLIIRNPHPATIAFHFNIHEETIELELHSTKELPQLPVKFIIYSKNAVDCEVHTYVGADLVTTSNYRQLSAAAAFLLNENSGI